MRTFALLLVCLSLIACRVAAALSFEVQKTINSLYHLEWSPLKTRLIEDCSDETFILDIQDITLTPAQPEAGKELLIEAEGVLHERVDAGAKAHVIVKMGVVQLLRRTFDLCDEAEKNDMEVQCPVENGYVKIAKTVTLPKEVPKAHYRVQVRAENYDGAPLACLNINVDFRRHRFF
ncbi:ML domain-containing protein [Dichotomocladium elegans]|nr:ML domain-containing protein [Dichotomocladium elegans]